MPLTHVRCCDQELTLEEALEHVERRDNRCQWTFELLNAMFDLNTAHPSNEDPTRISTTTLTSKCLRSETLKRFQPYTEDVDGLWASFRGTMFHRQLEKWAHPRAYAEPRFYVEDLFGLGPFSGSPDLVDPGPGILYDYKRTKEVPRFETVWPDHKEQLNINRWLVDHADYVELGGERYDLSDRKVRARFVPMDWQGLVIVYVDDKGPKPITVTKSIEVPAKTTGRTKKARVPDIWDDETVESLMEGRYLNAKQAFEAGIAPIPVGWENQSHVLCNYCPVRGECAQLDNEGA